MRTSPQQAAAEQLIHDRLEENDPDMLEAFADFAAGEIDDKHIAALLLSFIAEPEKSRNPGIHRMVMQRIAIQTLKHEMERQRAAFIEHEARERLAQADLHNEVAAEQARGSDD
jgi:hypothetical protein